MPPPGGASQARAVPPHPAGGRGCGRYLAAAPHGTLESASARAVECARPTEAAATTGKPRSRGGHSGHWEGRVVGAAFTAGCCAGHGCLVAHEKWGRWPGPRATPGPPPMRAGAASPSAGSMSGPREAKLEEPLCRAPSLSRPRIRRGIRAAAWQRVADPCAASAKGLVHERGPVHFASRIAQRRASGRATRQGRRPHVLGTTTSGLRRLSRWQPTLLPGSCAGGCCCAVHGAPGRAPSPGCGFACRSCSPSRSGEDRADNVFEDRLRKILGKRSTSARTSANAVQSIFVSPSSGSQNEEPLNLGSDNKVANEVIDLEGENQDAIVDEPKGKKPKKTKSECWDHFDQTFKTGGDKWREN